MDLMALLVIVVGPRLLVHIPPQIFLDSGVKWRARINEVRDEVDEL